MKVLTYHNIDKAPKGAKLKTLYVKPSQLERQISWLKRLGYAFGRSDDLRLAFTTKDRKVEDSPNPFEINWW